MNSAFLRLAKNDFVKGLIVAVAGAALGAIQSAFAAGTALDLSVITGALKLGIGAGGAYLIKNLFTNSRGEIGREVVDRTAKVDVPVKSEDPNGITGA